MATVDPTCPVDATARERLAADGLRLGLVDRSDFDAYAAWFRAESRGFMSPATPDDRIHQQRDHLTCEDRVIGVWDDSAADPASPVATIQTWVADLTVPGRTALPAWAISAVTVAPTHRRRGIARELLEGELRAAHGAGAPVAILTVSESTIYGRFGFAPAALARDLEIDTRRAAWTGPTGSGRVHFVTADRLRVDGLEIVEQVRLRTPGQMRYAGLLWDRQLGLMLGDEHAKNLRFIRHDDSDGRPQGFAIYSIVEDESDFTRHTLNLHTLVAASPDAYAGLWRFVLEMDLVSTVKAHLRPVDEPLRWLVRDFRSVRVNELDHLWTRVLDVPAALGARRYASPGRLTMTVADPLGFASGTWHIAASADGTATITASTEPADVEMSVSALGALLLGGVSARVLGAAGMLRGDAVHVDAMFRSPVAPYLSIWF